MYVDQECFTHFYINLRGLGMDDCKKILTSRGVVKMPIAASHTSGKIRLYCFLNQEPEVIAKIQTLFELEMKGKVYQGSLLNLFTTIQITPYLLREGIYFSLISTEEVCEWGKKLLGCSQQVIKFYKEVLEISIKLNNQVNKATSYSYLGDACYEMTHYREAITYHKSHLKIVLALGDRIGAGRVYGNLGCDYQKLKSYRKAIKYHENCLKIALELGYRTAEGRSYDNLGMAYQGVGDYRRAIECHENCLKIALELGYRTAEG
ncbi:MAG: tetratricopeptide repeat protein, partial [Candidatus Rhabdochlamydia sp.]